MASADDGNDDGKRDDCGAGVDADHGDDGDDGDDGDHGDDENDDDTDDLFLFE